MLFHNSTETHYLSLTHIEHTFAPHLHTAYTLALEIYIVNMVGKVRMLKFLCVVLFKGGRMELSQDLNVPGSIISRVGVRFLSPGSVDREPSLGDQEQ